MPVQNLPKAEEHLKMMAKAILRHFADKEAGGDVDVEMLLDYLHKKLEQIDYE